MVTSADLFHLPYYNKATYTGSICGMRYYIEKTAENETPVLRAWIFPGPFCFAKTQDSQKESKTFAFAEESLPAIASWLNEQYEQRASYWQEHTALIH